MQKYLSHINTGQKKLLTIYASIILSLVFPLIVLTCILLCNKTPGRI